MMDKNRKFCVFPAVGYWEIDGKPVSENEAKLNPQAVWKKTEIAKRICDFDAVLKPEADEKNG